jgi:phage terminase small subunit
MSEEKKLTRKQKVFIAEYLKTWNASESARRAGYSVKTAGSIGQRLLKDVEISTAIQTRLAEIHMSADEALKLLADMGRGDIGEVVDNNGLLDIRLAREKGMTKLLRKIKQKTVTRIGKSDDDDDVEIVETEFEMYSAKDAIDTILKAGGKLKDTDLTINVKLTDD